MTRKTYCGNLLWQSGLTLLVPMKKGSTVPAKYEAELNSVTQEIASMTAVRDIFRSFVAASDNDYRLRCAPTRFRTRVFRDLSQNFNDIVESSLKVDFAELPKAIDSLSQTLKVIIEVSRKMQGICRWYPPTTEGRSRQRRWLQGCEERHKAARQCVLGEA